MSAEKCCCCGLLSCFPCFAPITNPSRPAATHTVVESSHQLAPPSAVASSQVNASTDGTVMQNAISVPVPPSCSQGTHVVSSAPVSQPASSSRLPKESDHAKSVMESAKAVPTVMETAQTITPITNPSLAATHTVVQSSHQLSSSAPPPSVVASSQVNASTDSTAIQNAPSVPVLPSCSQGTVTSSAPSVPVPPSLRTAPSVAVPPSCSQATHVTSSSSAPPVPVPPSCSQATHVTSSAPPSQPASSSTPSSSSSSTLPGAKAVIEEAKGLDKDDVDVDLSGLINHISELFRSIEENVFRKREKPKFPVVAVVALSLARVLRSPSVEIGDDMEGLEAVLCCCL